MCHMTHSTVFEVDPELKEIFDKESTESTLLSLLKVNIRDEKFVLVHSVDGNIADGNVRTFLEENAACYLLVRSSASTWTLATFVPDNAPVRDKMLYASGRDTLRRAIGGSDRVTRDLQWTSVDEALLNPDKDASEPVVMTQMERLNVEDAKQTAAEAAGYAPAPSLNIFVSILTGVCATQGQSDLCSLDVPTYPTRS